MRVVNGGSPVKEVSPRMIMIGVGAILFGLLAMNCIKIIPPGMVGVGVLFGKVQETPYEPGPHLVNPMLSWELFDARQKSHRESASIPSQDQLQTRVDVSVQFRILASAAPHILKNTGPGLTVVDVHMVPKLRSILREQGKSIKRAEDFFLDTTQENLQASLLAGMQEFLAPKGIIVSAVLIRDINLPDFITKAIEAKKEREQAVEKQKAELERYITEQKQKVASAQAEREAAEEESKKRRVLADAQAYEIEKINRAIAGKKSYVQLRALEALKAISKDDSSKIYFLNGDSPQPLPLMNVGK